MDIESKFMKNFSIKFIDIMIGVVMGIGFQYVQELHEPWQFLAFLYVYIALIDYWIDYGPLLKKFPPKKELNVIIDIAVVFALFLFIFSVKYSIVYVIGAFIFLRVLDFVWLFVAKKSYKPTGKDLVYVDAYMIVDVVDCILAAVLIGSINLFSISSLFALFLLVCINLSMRIFASVKYKKAFLS